MKSLFSERDKNIFKSNLILYTMIFLALSFPFVVFILTDDLFVTLIFAGMALFYLLAVNNSIDTTFSSLNAIKLEDKHFSKDIKLKQFRNLVEELKIAAGYRGKIELYLINHDSINAMAVSRGNQAAVAITTGALEKLNREELSGVIGHEIAHIINADSDVKLSAYVAFGILATYMNLALRGTGMFSRRKRGGSFLVIILAVVGYILAMLMFFALSRKRETLADVESVRLTRNKYALISALNKIKKNSVLKVSDTASALFFANPLNPLDSKAFFNLFRTHPPLEERIKYLQQL